MEIRPAVQDDYDDIAGLITHELGYHDLRREDIWERLKAMENSAGHLTLVACVGNSVVGFIGLCRVITYETDEFIWILAFAVSEIYQRQGIGRALLAAAEDYAEKRRIKLIKVNCAFHRTNSHGFYEANGFVRKSYCFFKYL